MKTNNLSAVENNSKPVRNFLKLLFQFPIEWLNGKTAKLGIRLWMFRLKLAEDQAINLCSGDTKKRWIIRYKAFTYETLTTEEFNWKKKQGVFGSKIQAMNLDEVADSIVMWDSKNRCAKIIRKTELVITEFKK